MGNHKIQTDTIHYHPVNQHCGKSMKVHHLSIMFRRGCTMAFPHLSGAVYPRPRPTFGEGGFTICHVACLSKPKWIPEIETHLSVKTCFVLYHFWKLWGDHSILISWQQPFHPFMPRANQAAAMRAQRRASDAGDAAFRSMNHPAIWVLFFHENSVTIPKLGYHDFGKLYCTYIYTYIYMYIHIYVYTYIYTFTEDLYFSEPRIWGNSYRFSSWKKELFLNWNHHVFDIGIHFWMFLVHRQWNTVQYRACVCVDELNIHFHRLPTHHF